MAKTKKEIKVKEPVRIREKVLDGGTISLYLDMYYKGNRKKEGLKLYIIPETSPAAKLQNKNTRKLAEQIKAQRILDIQKDGLVDWEKLKRSRTTLLSWLEWCDEYIRYSAGCGNGESAMRQKTTVRKRINEYLELVGKTDILLKDVTTEVISGLYDYMRNDYRNPGQIKVRDGRMSDYSLRHFGETINAMFNKALREGKIGYNPLRGLNKLERFHVADKHREYLTPDELKLFLAVEAATETKRQVQRAFGFSCMTGLRLGDMQLLRWCDIIPMGDGWAVSIVQHKTGSPVTVPLNDLALSLLPPRPENEDENVFHLPTMSGNVTKHIRSIRDKAGITGKELTFHCSRHTAATLAISAGAELYTVSKILGHRNLVSTQVYAKVNLDKKIEAINLTKGVFD